MTPEEKKAFAIKAVNRLIADAEARRLVENKELAETIAVCVASAEPEKLATLAWLLDQQKLERPDLEGEDDHGIRPIGGSA